MKAARTLAIVLGVIIIVLLGVLFFYNPAKAPPIASVPAPVVSADGHLSVSSLHANDVVTSPLTVTGTVTGGGWFFEGSFPIKIVDGDGATIGTGVAQAQADWMSTSSVPFTAIISFTAAHRATGTVLFSKDNPSGLSQNDASLAIPVRFE
jgi:hypothetical protein